MVLPLRHHTSPVDIKPTVSQRCEPSSRSLLIGEHPHPWLLLHSQDRKSRHRCSKPRRRYVLEERHNKSDTNFIQPVASQQYLVLVVALRPKPPPRPFFHFFFIFSTHIY